MSAVANDKAVTKRPIEQLRDQVIQLQPQFAMALPPHIQPEKFVRVTMTAIQNNPDLLTCDRQSLLSSCMKCAADGLLPDGREAAFVTFNTKSGGLVAQYIPMVGGICKKARNSGEIATIDAQVVYEKDQYEAWADEKGQHFKHVKERGDRGNPILTYAYAITKDGGFYFEEVDETQMGAIENASRAKNGPWKGAFRDEMKRKSALRRLAKYRLPSSTDLDEVIRRDDELFDFDGKKAAKEKAQEITQAIQQIPAPAPVAETPEVLEPGANG